MRRRSQPGPDVEPLETRISPVGFDQGPPVAPFVIALRGTISVSAVAVPSRSGAETISLSGAGSLSPLGRTTVRGSLRISGGVERGSLSVVAPQYRLTVNLRGAAPSPASPTVSRLAESVSGRGPVPYTSTEEFVNEQGFGTVVVTLGSAEGRGPASLQFLA